MTNLLQYTFAVLLILGNIWIGNSNMTTPESYENLQDTSLMEIRSKEICNFIGCTGGSQLCADAKGTIKLEYKGSGLTLEVTFKCYQVPHVPEVEG